MAAQSFDRPDNTRLSREEFEQEVHEELFAVVDFLLDHVLRNSADFEQYLSDVLKEASTNKGRPDPYLDENFDSLFRDLSAFKDLVDRAHELHENGIVKLLLVLDSVSNGEGSKALLLKLIEDARSQLDGPAKDAAKSLLEKYYRTPKLDPIDENQA